MELDKDEVKLILRHREEKAASSLYFLKQQLCQHEWIDEGEYHGETYYRCNSCGKFKWV